MSWMCQRVFVGRTCVWSQRSSRCARKIACAVWRQMRAKTCWLSGRRVFVALFAHQVHQNVMDSGIPLDVKPSQPEENRVDNKGPSIRELTASDRPAPRFPAKLWAAVNDSRSDLLTWDRDGTAFMVHEHRFCNEVMTAHPGLVQAAAFNNFRRYWFC